MSIHDRDDIRDRLRQARERKIGHRLGRVTQTTSGLGAYPVTLSARCECGFDLPLASDRRTLEQTHQAHLKEIGR